MTQMKKVVTRIRAKSDRLPDFAGPAALAILELNGAGVLEEVARRLRVHREGGYCGIDGFLFLLSYFLSDTGVGIREFSTRIRGCGRALAALGERRSLMTPASLSRLLSAVDASVVRGLSTWLLVVASGVLDVLRHPWVLTRDAHGRGWHVFERDGRVRALRHRALPSGDGFPVAKRRSEPLAAPGYSGRKRGDVQFHRSMLQHAGSGACLNLRIAPGNGEHRPEIASDLEVIRQVCGLLEAPLDRVLLRMDGEFGWVPYLTAVREAGIACITRVTRPELLDQPDVRKRLVEGAWVQVMDNAAGPKRSALDLGLVTLRPGRETERDDGSDYDPIEVRVVVSRYPRDREPDHGRMIDGWQYEMFAALDLEPSAWPAADVVAMYFGRSGQENRFMQEDREVHLQRIFSYSPAGQELANLIGLFTWNRALARGIGMQPPTRELPPTAPRQDIPDPRPVPASTASVTSPEPTGPSVKSPDELEQARASLAKQLDGLDWVHLLRRRGEGWQYVSGKGALTCPAGRLLLPTSVGPGPNSKMRVQFLAPAGTCNSCALRRDCLSSARPDACKLTCVPIDPGLALPIKERIERLHRVRRLHRSAEILEKPPPSGRSRPIPSGTPLAVRPLPGHSPGPCAIDGSFLAAAVARRNYREACRRVLVHVSLDLPDQPGGHPLFAGSPARRQRRRLTWDERLKRHALPEGTGLAVMIEADLEVIQALGLPPPGQVAA